MSKRISPSTILLAMFTTLLMFTGPATQGSEPDPKATARAAVERASQAWIAAFNRGDANACADAYTEDAVMTAQPIADLEGRESIRAFWTDVLAGNPGTLHYEDPQIHVLDAQTAVLSSRWSMSQLGSGIITLELWKQQQDGTWRLAEDRFEILQKKTIPQPTGADGVDSNR